MATMTLQSFTKDLERSLGADLTAAVLYGSAVGTPDAKGANLLVLVKTLRPDALRRVAAAVAGWRQAGHPAPLVMTEAEWRSSRDVFAMEHADIAGRHEVLSGALPAAAAVSVEDLRRQLEYEAMGALIHLRQGLLACHGDAELELQLLAASKGTVLALLRALLRVHGDAVPADAADLVRAAAARAGFDPAPFLDVVAHAQGRTIPAARADDVLESYHLGLKRLVAQVDAMVHPDAPAVD